MANNYLDSCSGCGEKSIERMDTGELVCTSCGLMNDSDIFVSLEGEAKSQNLCHKDFSDIIKHAPLALKKKHSFKRVSFIKESSIQLIRKLSSDFHLDRATCKILMTNYSKLYDIYKFKSKEFKYLVAAALVFAALRASNIVFTTSDFFNNLGSCPSKFYSVYQKVKIHIDFTQEQNEKENGVRALLRYCPQTTLEEREAYCRLVKDTLKILSFAESHWLVTGRSLEASTVACAFVAWKSVGDTRMKKTFGDFCSLFKFDAKKKTAGRRLSELRSLFIKLGQRLPFGNTITKKTVYVHINAIMSLNEVLSEEVKQEDNNELENFKEFRNSCPPVINSIRDPKIDCDVADEDLIPDDEWGEHIRFEEEIPYVKKLKDMGGLPY